MTVTQFTPLASTIGGALIGIAAVMLMAFNGRIAGISGILGRLFPPYAVADAGGAAAFIAGMLAAPFLYTAVIGESFTQTVSGNLPLMLGAGLLVGFGASLGGGCTSGHGVCGLARLSLRSVIATMVFMGVAIVTVFVTRHLLGG
jgi:uncharacterized membrane protein YedE/YeeE